MSNTVRPEAALEQAQFQVAEAKKRLAATRGALQYRMKPANLLHNAVSGAREKGEAAADSAMGTARGHPGAIGGVLAAATLFLAREPIWRALSGMFGKDRHKDPNVVTTDLDGVEGNFDLTAPTVERSKLEGVTA